ncbi:MAG: hypothetical protein RLZZ422_333 [Pseudomonadota bacterium]|jgi:hypothetical protein
MNNIRPANMLVESLNKSLTDTTTDFLEIGIDSLINNEILQEIPIVKSLIGTIKCWIFI